MSDGDTYTLPSACVQSDLNETRQESVAVHVFHQLISLNASQECVEGFKPWICRQLYSVCQNHSYINSTGEECEVFQSLCAAGTSSLLMTGSLLRNVCFFSTTATSSQVG